MVHAIGDNHPASSAARSTFSVEEATEMLPLVRRIVDDLVRLNRAVQLQQVQLQGMEDVQEMASQKHYADELEDMRGSLKADEAKLQACLAELQLLGVEPHLPVDGGVDFPAELNRRKVRLCWYPQEQEVMYWHEAGKPPHHRQRIDPEAFGKDSLN